MAARPSPGLVTARTSPLSILGLYWGRRGGGARYAFQMFRALSAIRNVSVHASVSMNSRWFDRFARLEVQPVAIRTFSHPLGVAHLPRALMEAARVGRHVQQHNLDAVYVPATHPWDLLAARQARLARVPYVLTVHDAFLHPGEQSVVAQWLLHREIERADAIICLSEHVRQQLLELRPAGSITVIPHPPFMPEVSMARCRQMRRAGPVRLLHVGRQASYKGGDTFIEVVAALRGEGVNVEATIAGAGPRSSQLAARAREAGITVIPRWLEEAELERLVDAADVVVLPYREASQSGVVALATGLGVPSVVTPVGGLTEQVRNGPVGVVAASTGVRDVVEAVGRLIDDDALYQRCSGSALAVSAGPCSWTVAATQVAATVAAAASQR